MRHPISIIVTRLVFLLGVLAPLSVGAQEAAYPSRPIRVVLGFAAGGGTDVTARILVARVSQQVGVPVVLENRAGGQGVIATQTVVRAAPDGYTVLYNTSSLITSPSLMRDPGYDWRRDLVPVVGLASVPLVLMPSPNLPVRNAAEFVALLKRRNGELTYASAGIGNTTHLAILRMLQDIGATAVHVPYSGDGPALTDLLRSTTDFYIGTINTALPHIRDGRLRALGIGTPERLANLPDVPTLAETMAPGYEAESWHGLMVPAGTPDPVVQRLGAEFLRALAGPEIQSRLSEMSVVPRPRPQAAYRAYVEAEARKWHEVITTAGLRIE